MNMNFKKTKEQNIKSLLKTNALAENDFSHSLEVVFAICVY